MPISQRINHIISKTGCKFRFLKLVFCFLLIQPNINYAEELPLWELGLGLGGIHQPFYPGSDETRNFLFPVPLPIYRGNIVKSDDEGVRAELVVSDRIKFDMSLDFNLAFDSDDVELREGMDDIGSLLQIGPSMQINLKEDEHNQWLLKLPLRANFDFNDGVDNVGYTFAPNVTYFRHFAFKGEAWRFGASVGPSFGSSDSNNFYYGVDPQFATASRAQYQSDGGYSGARGLFTLKSQNSKRLIVWFLRYDNISGAKFEDSPLVETSGGVSAGFVYSRFLWKSKTMVSQ